MNDRDKLRLAKAYLEEVKTNLKLLGKSKLVNKLEEIIKELEGVEHER